jgi:hypothetical protein
MTHRIVQSQEIHVPGNVTNAELWPQIGVQYGLQICAFYGDRGAFETPQSDPFRIVAVIPFTCTQCQGRTPQGCIDCSKIEQQIGKGGSSGKIAWDSGFSKIGISSFPLFQICKPNFRLLILNM